MEKSKQLILNPVENLPYYLTAIETDSSLGLYVSDKVKTDDVVKNSIIGFSGREKYNQHIHKIYQDWAEALHAPFFSMRLLSGLHAHIIIFMGIGSIGDKVLLLPESAGGHYATKGILNRLGYHVIEMAVDNKRCCIDIPTTQSIIAKEHPDFIFVDRSEGINYEDFTDLLSVTDSHVCSIFDASQYLTNILMEDFKSPFDMGFDVMLSTMHKNFPGPQKALVCSQKESIHWKKIQQGMSDYVSSLHVSGILMAEKIFKQKNLLKYYSRQMLTISALLENFMKQSGIPVAEKRTDCPPTHHIWIPLNDKDKAFNFYKNMEVCNLLVNYRKLPYNQGYGIRLGTSAAILQGINEYNVKELADIISSIYFENLPVKQLSTLAEGLIMSLEPLTETYCATIG